MVSIYIVLVLGFVSILFLGHSTYFWFRIWKEHHSSSAHAMTLSLILILFLAILGLGHNAVDLLQMGMDEVSISVLMSSFTFFYSVVQVLFTRGYFLKGEVQ